MNKSEIRKLTKEQFLSGYFGDYGLNYFKIDSRLEETAYFLNIGKEEEVAVLTVTNIQGGVLKKLPLNDDSVITLGKSFTISIEDNNWEGVSKVEFQLIDEID